MAITLATFMFWARMSQVGSTTVILGTNGFLIRLSSFPFSPLLSLLPESTLPIFFRGNRRLLLPPETSSNSGQLVQTGWDLRPEWLLFKIWYAAHFLRKSASLTKFSGPLLFSCIPSFVYWSYTSAANQLEPTMSSSP
jgi:hypothetical protein